MTVGDKVRLKSTGEVGIVIHSWHDTQLSVQDNYIAFFGDEIPSGEPEAIPYVLRYLSSSLEKIE